MDMKPRPLLPSRHSIGFVAVLAAALLVALFAGRAVAQETPEPTAATPLPTPEATHVAQETPALIRIVAPKSSVAVDHEFEVQVEVKDAQNVASFGITLAFPQARATFLRAEDVGAFLKTSERQVVCSDANILDGKLSLSCVTPGAPFCFGGPPGASGSGLLVRLTFRALQEGDVSLQLGDPTSLVLDDLEPCDPENGRAIDIPHRLANATIEVAGGGGTSWALIAIIVGAAVVVVVVGGGVGWYASRRRGGAG